MCTCEQIKAKCQTPSMNISADVLALISMVNSDLMLLFNDYRCRNVLTGNCPNLRRLHIWQLLLNSITTKYLNLQPDRFFNPQSNAPRYPQMQSAPRPPCSPPPFRFYPMRNHNNNSSSQNNNTSYPTSNSSSRCEEDDNTDDTMD